MYEKFRTSPRTWLPLHSFHDLSGHLSSCMLQVSTGINLMDPHRHRHKSETSNGTLHGLQPWTSFGHTFQFLLLRSCCCCPSGLHTHHMRQHRTPVTDEQCSSAAELATRVECLPQELISMSSHILTNLKASVHRGFAMIMHRR